MVELVEQSRGSTPFDYRPSRQPGTGSLSGRKPNSAQPKTRPLGDLNSRFSHYFTSAMSRLAPIAFSIVVVGVLFMGWLYRNEGHLTAETGTGYWLGIVGASLMLALLLYPLRKRIKLMRSWGRVSHWFGVHMILGVIGPVLIVLHSNFQLGSLNSTVALFAMLLVAGSGLVGRYLYAKIHAGLYGRKIEVRTLLEDAGAIEDILGRDLAHAETIIQQLRAFETEALDSNTSATKGVWGYLGVGSRSKMHARTVRDSAKILVAEHCRERGVGWWARRQLLRKIDRYCAVYFKAVNKAARFSAFERLFALWHVLHLPLFFLLVLAAIVHVIAVHLY